ncbi:hypothetical protein DFO67_108124 [Modicisalibacter xianhensis]|uniref:Uncharacterized protein n=1 Tax=Modicisalibacter xianhensis TaxID=442341 RepID=A0A4R8FY63_9GAMM|nr:hypothetical protein DFO67_108124 [Halomonas xianhensis]
MTGLSIRGALQVVVNALLIKVLYQSLKRVRALANNHVSPHCHDG